MYDVVVAIDPGARTSGLAVVELATGELREWSQLTSQAEVVRGALAWQTGVIVCEAYVGAGYRDAASTRTIELIGALRLTAEIKGVEFVLAIPQIRRAFLSQARLLVPKAKRHAVDAVAHALAYRARMARTT